MGAPPVISRLRAASGANPSENSEGSRAAHACIQPYRRRARGSSARRPPRCPRPRLWGRMRYSMTPRDPSPLQPLHRVRAKKNGTAAMRRSRVDSFRLGIKSEATYSPYHARLVYTTGQAWPPHVSASEVAVGGSILGLGHQIQVQVNKVIMIVPPRISDADSASRLRSVVFRSRSLRSRGFISRPSKA